MTRNDEHLLNGAIPAEIAENLIELCPEFGDLNDEEVLQHQESIYQSLQGYDRNKDNRSYYGQSSDWSQFSGQEGKSSRHGSFDSQLASDEALARALQELGDEFDDWNISQSAASTATENKDVGSRETTVTPLNQNVTQDDIDPDDMTYEQLQALEESVGSENKGLSEELISRLPNFKYKTGRLSKKKEKQECVICFTSYENGDRLTTLLCAHHYHSKCIKRWLRLNKSCPVCQKEVEVSED